HAPKDILATLFPPSLRPLAGVRLRPAKLDQHQFPVLVVRESDIASYFAHLTPFPSFLGNPSALQIRRDLLFGGLNLGVGLAECLLGAGPPLKIAFIWLSEVFM